MRISISYRKRLLLYSLGMLVFLAGTLLYSYQYVQHLIYNQAEAHITRVAQLSRLQLHDLRTTLQHYTHMVAGDQDLLKSLARASRTTQAVRQHYEKNFAWLPIDRYLILDRRHRIVAGHTSSAVYRKIIPLLKTGLSASFFLKHGKGLQLVAAIPLKLDGTSLGTYIVSRDLTQTWLNEFYQATGVIAFFEQDGTILSSSVPELAGATFNPQAHHIAIREATYNVQHLPLEGAQPGLPNLWFALPDTDMTQRLGEHRRMTLYNVAIGALAILILGMLFIHNFSKPLSQLMCMTREIAKGNLPEVPKSRAKNEIAALANQFVDMVKALRAQQEEIERVHAALEKSAITDVLTGLYNRRYLQVVFPKLVAQAQRDDHEIAAILIDVDHFKQINDRYGHIIGDKCLAHFADELRQYSRASDYLFRIGGEEFLVLSITEDLDGIYRFAEKLRHKIEQSPVQSKPDTIPLTISCGISIADATESGQEMITHLLSRADRAMYQAKKLGRNRVCMATDLPERPQHRSDAENPSESRDELITSSSPPV